MCYQRLQFATHVHFINTVINVHMYRQSGANESQISLTDINTYFQGLGKHLSVVLPPLSVTTTEGIFSILKMLIKIFIQPNNTFNSLWPGDDVWGDIRVNFGSGNGLLPASTKPLPEPMLTYQQWGSVAFIWGSFTGSAQDINPENEF